MKTLIFILLYLPFFLFSQPEENKGNEFIPKNYFGVNFMPQAVWSNGSAFSSGVDYLNEINPKIIFEADLLYSQQDGRKICDSTERSNDLNVLDFCYSSKSEKLIFIKAPVLIHYNLKKDLTASQFSLIFGTQPQFLLINNSILTPDNQHNVFSMALMGGISYKRRLKNDLFFFSQIRFEYTYRMIKSDNEDNFAAGVMVGLMFGKSKKQK